MDFQAPGAIFYSPDPKEMIGGFLTERAEQAGEIHVLVGEDNDDDILILKEALSTFKFVRIVGTASDGEEAIELFRREGRVTADSGAVPRLILLDINMPKKNGFEVLREIRLDPDLKRVVVLMLTVSNREEDILLSYELGANAFVNKPVDFEKFKDHMGRVLSYWAKIIRP